MRTFRIIVYTVTILLALGWLGFTFASWDENNVYTELIMLYYGNTLHAFIVLSLWLIYFQEAAKARATRVSFFFALIMTISFIINVITIIIYKL